MGFLTACLVLPVSVIIFCLAAPFASLKDGHGIDGLLDVVISAASFVLMVWSAVRVLSGFFGFILGIFSTVLSIIVVIVLAVLVYRWFHKTRDDLDVGDDGQQDQ